MTNYLADHSHFTSRKELDEATRQHEYANWHDMNDTDRNVLDMIRRNSARFGASHLKHDAIADAIGKSNATVRRTIRKLERLGILERIHFIRPVMKGLGANIYAIKPYSEQTQMNTDEFGIIVE